MRLISILFLVLFSLQGFADQYCEYDWDCSALAGRCIDRGDGINVCIDKNSSSNKYCEYQWHCGGNGNCINRGDGVNVCRDNAEHGVDYCEYNWDCEGIYEKCIDRGDGVNVCMKKRYFWE